MSFQSRSGQNNRNHITLEKSFETDADIMTILLQLVAEVLKRSKSESLQMNILKPHCESLRPNKLFVWLKCCSSPESINLRAAQSQGDRRKQPIIARLNWSMWLIWEAIWVNKDRIITFVDFGLLWNSRSLSWYVFSTGSACTIFTFFNEVWNSEWF